MFLMAGRGRSFTAVDWCIAIMCHNVKYCMAVDDSGIRSGLFWCGRCSIQSGVNDISAFSWESIGVVVVWTISSSLGWAEN